MKRSLLFLGLFAFFSSIALADDTPGDIVDRKEYDPDRPYYETLKPSWAVGFRFTFPNFPYIQGHPSIYNLFVEKFLPFQWVGIFSAGIHAGTGSFQFRKDLGGTNIDMFGVGASARYQMYLFRNQLIVPTASLVYDNFRYGGEASNALGPMFGAMLNLNFFDAQTARQGAQSIDLLRSYLTVEFRPLMKVTSGGVTALVGNAWYFGVLLELE